MYDYPMSDQKYEPLSSGLNLCGCMGPMYGEPLCPCGMARENLPLSVSHVIAYEKDKIEMAKFFSKYFERP
jgi:hypothetical protein